MRRRLQAGLSANPSIGMDRRCHLLPGLLRRRALARQWRGVLIMNTPCAVSIDERRHQQDCEDAERRARAVSDEALSLITGELSIYDEENFVSALSDLIERYDPALGTIHRALLAGNLNIAAQTLYQAVGKVLVARADVQAEAYVAKACQDCYGRGCRECDPPEPDDQSDRYFD